DSCSRAERRCQMCPVSRGFHGRGAEAAGTEDRVPPGQYVTSDFPVLSAGPTPHTPQEEWTFSIRQEGSPTKSWTWSELRELPAEPVTAHFPGLPRWSTLDPRWQAVWVDTLLERVEHDVEYVLASCAGGSPTNLPLADVTDGQAWIAFGYEDEPLPAEHGG